MDREIHLRLLHVLATITVALATTATAAAQQEAPASVEITGDPFRALVYCPFMQFINGPVEGCAGMAAVHERDGDTYYVGPGNVYRESNGCEGQQRDALAPPECDGGDAPFRLDHVVDGSSSAQDAAACGAAWSVAEEPTPCTVTVNTWFDVYYVEDGDSVYQETNGCAGLQTRAGECTGGVDTRLLPTE